MILLNKHERCKVQSPVHGEIGPKAPPVGREWMCMFNMAIVVSRVILQYCSFKTAFLVPYSIFLFFLCIYVWVAHTIL